MKLPMHQSNHKEEDFFDLLDRPVGVVPKNQNFEAAPPDKTRSNISYTPPKPTLNLGQSLGEPRKSSMSIKPMSDEEMFHMSMGFASPGVAAVKAVSAGAGVVKGAASVLKQGAKLLRDPVAPVRSGNFDVYKVDDIMKDSAKKLPALKTGNIRNVFQDDNYNLVESVVPMAGYTSQIGKEGLKGVYQHVLQIRPAGKYNAADNLSRLKFRERDYSSSQFGTVKLLDQISFFGKPTQSGKIMKSILDRAETNWMIDERMLTIDSFYGMTKGLLRHAAEIEFYGKGTGMYNRYRVSEFSPFTRIIKKALDDGKPLGPVLDDLAAGLTNRLKRSGKLVGDNPKIRGDEAVTGFVSRPFYVKSFQDRLAALFGFSAKGLDDYLGQDVGESNQKRK